MIHLIGLLGQACAKPNVGSAKNSAATTSRKMEDERMLFLLLIVGMNEVSHPRIVMENGSATQDPMLRCCFFIHGNRVDYALLGAYGAAVTAVAVVQHRNFSPSLLFKGKKPQMTGGNAPATS